MLTSILASSYRAYKEDTDVVATWLASTAKRCGISVGSDARQPEKSIASSRLKGKARKMAKEATGSNAAGSTSKGSKYVLQVQDFTRLAAAIADSNKTLNTMPVAIAKALDRAIKLRLEHSATFRFLKNHSSGKESRAEYNHS